MKPPRYGPAEQSRSSLIPTMALPSLSGASTDNSTNSSQFQDEQLLVPAPEDSTESQHDRDHSTSSLKSSTMHTNQNSSEESSSLAKAETLRVRRSKLLVLMVLFLAAAAVGVATYIYTRNTENATFETKVRKKHACPMGHDGDVIQ